MSEATPGSSPSTNSDPHGIANKLFRLIIHLFCGVAFPILFRMIAQPGRGDITPTISGLDGTVTPRQSCLLGAVYSSARSMASFMARMDWNSTSESHYFSCFSFALAFRTVAIHSFVCQNQSSGVSQNQPMSVTSKPANENKSLGR